MFEQTTGLSAINTDKYDNPKGIVYEIYTF